MIQQQEIEERIQRFDEKCRENGIKMTHQRLEIFREVAQSGEHPDAESVFHGVRKRLPTVSLDTIYRTLWLLQDLGLIVTLNPHRERTRFDANLRRHHHYVCIRCDKVRDFESEAFDALRIPDEVLEFGSIIDTHVEVRGICKMCSKGPVGKPASRNPQPAERQERKRS